MLVIALQKVRMGALQCLGMLTSFETHRILPHKARILRALKPVLDDHKRLVRLEATKAISEWLITFYFV